jgi:release factor glutamine methyltransferase
LGTQEEQAWDVLKLLRWTQNFLQKKGLENARLDSEVMLGHLLSLRRIDLYARYDRQISLEELATFKGMIQQRVARRPVAYIIGKREFWSMEFEVDENVLIPRPDTELLVERARQRARECGEWRDPNLVEEEAVAEVDVESEAAAAQVEATPGAELSYELDPDADDDDVADDDEGDGEAPVRPARAAAAVAAPASAQAAAPRPERKAAGPVEVDVLDLGTGSGAIAVALASELPGARIVATDISAGALGVARRNAARLGFEGAIRFVEGDLLAPVGAATFDVIVSNPPYITEAELSGLAPEVAMHEPRIALSPGPEGLEILRRIAREAWGALKPGGWVMCEIGHQQGSAARALFEGSEHPWAEIALVKDSVSHQVRAVEARKPRG